MTAGPIPRKRGFCYSMRFEERHVSRIGAIERLLAAAAHHHVENELVAVFIGIDAERADLVGLLRLVWIIEGEANKRRLTVAAFDGGELGDLRLGIAATQRALLTRAKSASVCCLSR